MRIICKRMTLLVLLLLTNPIFAADVWKVSSAKGHVYLGGTFHLLTPNDYPLPAEYDLAYRNSQKLVLETDLDTLRDSQFAPRLLAAVQYPAGQSITRSLKPETLRMIREFLDARKVPFENVVMLRPGMLSVTLSMIELNRLGLTGTGVDEHFHERAKQDNRPIRWFESAEEQMDILAHMGEGHEDELIAYTLQDMDKVPQLMTAMKKAWRDGDNEALEQICVTPYEKEFKPLMDSLLDKRNARWLPVLEAMINDSGTEYILVGALHLVGEDGLLDTLAKRGYRVEKVVATQH